MKTADGLSERFITPPSGLFVYRPGFQPPQRRSAGWSEDDHPRGPDGKFGTKGLPSISHERARDKVFEYLAVEEYAETDMAPVNERYRKRSFTQARKAWDALDDDQKQVFRDTVTQQSYKPIRVRMSLTSLDLVLGDGRIKSLHETGRHSNRDAEAGYVDVRGDYEYNGPMNLDGTPDREMPIYGLFGEAEDGEAYGETTVTLKDQVRNRTSMTVGDSLNASAQPYPSNIVGALSDEQLVLASSFQEIRSASQGSFLSYMEAQIHGGVTLDDIDSVHLPYRFQGSDNDLTVQKLKDAGIAVQFFPPDPDEDPMAGLSEKQLLALGLSPERIAELGGGA